MGRCLPGVLLIVAWAAAPRCSGADAPGVPPEVRKLVKDVLAASVPNAPLPIARLPVDPSLLPGLLAEAKSAGDDADKRLVALALLVRWDARGQYAGDAFELVRADGPFAASPEEYRWERATADVQRYLFRCMTAPGDPERLAGTILADQRQAWAFVRRTVNELPLSLQARLYPLLLPRVKGMDVLRPLVAHADYYVGGDAMRDALLRMADDEALPPDVRLDAALAWAARGAKGDYDRVREVLEKAQPWQDAPHARTIETLAMLDWSRAQAEFTEAYGVIRKRQAPVAQPGRRGDEPPDGPAGPWPYEYYGTLDLCGSEQQVREVLGELVACLNADGRIAMNGPENARLVETAFREAAPLVKGGRFPSAHNTLEIYFNMGLDPEPLLRHALDFEEGGEVLKLTASSWQRRFIPAPLLDKYRGEFVARALRILDQYPVERDDMADWEKVTTYDAFATLCVLAPEKADHYVDRFIRRRPAQAAALVRSPEHRKAVATALRNALPEAAKSADDWDLYNLAEPLMRCADDDDLAFARGFCRGLTDAGKRVKMLHAMRRRDPAFACAELTTMLKARSDEGRRLEIAQSLLHAGAALDADQTRLVESELLDAMRNSAGAPRLDYAADLAILGNEEGWAVVESFLKGDWRPRVNYWSVFHDFTRIATAHPEPYAGRARSMLVRAATEHPDPNVRSRAVRACGDCLGVRGGADGGFPLAEMVLAQLDPARDWRVRCQAGLVLRRAFRDARPGWDYYHFWPPDRQKQSADDLRRWWTETKHRLRWQPTGDYPSLEGAFVLAP